VLGLVDALAFIDDVSAFYELPQMDLVTDDVVHEAVDESGHRKSQLDLTELNMKRIANCKMYVSADQNVHLVHAMQWAVKVVMAKNDPQSLQDIEEAEEQDEKMQKLIAQQEHRQSVNFILQGVAIDISVQVATLKIQKRLKKKLERARERIKTRTTQAEASTKAAAGAAAEDELSEPRIAG